METSRQKSKNRKGKNYAKIDVFSDSDCQAKSSQNLEKNSRKTHSIGTFRYSSTNQRMGKSLITLQMIEVLMQESKTELEKNYAKIGTFSDSDGLPSGILAKT